MNIELMMLQVLDEPTSVRIIVETKYPDITAEDMDNVYFMIDRGDCETFAGANDAQVFDYWQVSDSIGQTRKFNSNVELINFLDSIDSIIANARVESF